MVMLDMWVFNHPHLGTKCCLMVLYNIANNLNMAQLSQLPVLPHESVAEVSKIGNLQERLGCCEAWMAERIH